MSSSRVWFSILLSTNVLAVEPIQYSLLIAGPKFTGIIDEQVQPVWDAGRPAARDGWVLNNG
jgi:hypothetical protein